MIFPSSQIDPAWLPLITQALNELDSAYLNRLKNTTDWLPGPTQIFNAFSLPLSKTRYILFGESPYPRALSANGYAFWDGQVKNLWSDKGFDVRVNRATSLRNLLKMLLLAEGLLKPQNLSQATIAKLDKSHLIKTGDELFGNFLKQGFLLLNATLVLNLKQSVKKEAHEWHVFIEKLLELLITKNNHLKLLLFGKIAHDIDALPAAINFEKIYAEHPYNLSFIQNPVILNFFRPLHLLRA